MAKLKYLVIHCTATPEGREVSAATIRRWHTAPPPEGRGWKQVGYSAMIHLDGTIESLVAFNDNDIIEPWEITNGAVGINSVARHIVYVGGTDKDGRAKDTRTKDQLLAMEFFVLDQVAKYPNIEVAGHNQFAKKDCPSFIVADWLRSIGIKEENIL